MLWNERIDDSSISARERLALPHVISHQQAVATSSTSAWVSAGRVLKASKPIAYRWWHSLKLTAILALSKWCSDSPNLQGSTHIFKGYVSFREGKSKSIFQIVLQLLLLLQSLELTSKAPEKICFFCGRPIFRVTVSGSVGREHAHTTTGRDHKPWCAVKSKPPVAHMSVWWDAEIDMFKSTMYQSIITGNLPVKSLHDLRFNSIFLSTYSSRNAGHVYITCCIIPICAEWDQNIPSIWSHPSSPMENQENPLRRLACWIWLLTWWFMGKMLLALGGLCP